MKVDGNNWYGFYPELDSGEEITLTLTNYERSCSVEVAVYSFGPESESSGY
jgi:hypothetical protein